MVNLSNDNDDTVESSSEMVDNTKPRHTNNYLQVLYEELLNFINEPRVAKFAFQFFMISTGAILLKILADRDFPLQDTIQFMMLWFVLMLFLPTPKGAKTDVNPFGEDISFSKPSLQQIITTKSKIVGPEDLQQCPKCEKFSPMLSQQCDNCGAELLNPPHHLKK